MKATVAPWNKTRVRINFWLRFVFPLLKATKPAARTPAVARAPENESDVLLIFSVQMCDWHVWMITLTAWLPECLTHVCWQIQAPINIREHALGQPRQHRHTLFHETLRVSASLQHWEGSYLIETRRTWLIRTHLTVLHPSILWILEPQNLMLFIWHNLQ